jgi:hypothetical protein
MIAQIKEVAQPNKIQAKDSLCLLLLCCVHCMNNMTIQARIQMEKVSQM